jgi:hypothetical protein
LIANSIDLTYSISDMKVYKSGYRNHWLSPYTILKVVCFWEKDDSVFYNHEDEPNHFYDKVVDFLTPISRAIQWVLDVVHPRIDYVKIDKYDTWSMDNTLANIILPMLKQLKEDKHGSPNVDDEDVPKELRSIYALPKDYYDLDGNYFQRWDWVLGEMIYAFESKCDPHFHDQFHTGEYDLRSVVVERDENGKATMFKMVEGPNHTAKYDAKASAEAQSRISNGLRLFGKYYEGLWD